MLNMYGSLAHIQLVSMQHSLTFPPLGVVWISQHAFLVLIFSAILHTVGRIGLRC